MAKVNIVNVMVLDNPSPFLNPFQFEITFEALEDLSEDLEWKIIYVGAAESEEFDQTLETILVGPVPGGRHKFVFQAGPPDTSKIPQQDAVGVTVILLTCSYRNKEFIRVGYYVNNEYEEQELKEEPPSTPLYDKLMRNILATNPRVTRFKIDWDDNQSTATENGENIPPVHNLESESNQMVPGGTNIQEDLKSQVVPEVGNGMDIDETSVSMS
ncbi:ASF1 anti-silencing function 1 [Mactra antiquata]